MNDMADLVVRVERLERERSEWFREQVDLVRTVHYLRGRLEAVGVISSGDLRTSPLSVPAGRQPGP
jgi:hypothetical protein